MPAVTADTLTLPRLVEPGLDAIDIQVDVDGGLGLEGPHVAVQGPPEVGAVEGAPAQVRNRGADVGDGTGDLLLDG